jgi:hypothetical protein
MSISFSFSEMKDFLERRGFVLTKDSEIEEYHWNGIQSEKRSYTVWNVWYKGILMTDTFKYLGGTRRVEEVFKLELKKKLLTE